MYRQNGSFNFFFRNYSAWLVAVVMMLFVICFYSDIFFSPGSYLFNDKGDALKNYYCFSWHIDHDDSFINFTGLNYPYGENFIYTDGHPLLSNTLKALGISSRAGLSIFNLSLLFSFVFCAILLFKILREFNVLLPLAVISSLGITILCPQVLRLSGHLTLSYGFSIPLTIYLIILFEKREKRFIFLTLLLLSLVTYFFVHPYLGMVNASLPAVYALLRMLFRGSGKHSLFLLITAALPPMFFMLFTKLTDTHTNRPDDPYGFLFFLARVESVFISTMPPFRHFLSQIYPVREQNWEGIAYVGLPSIIALGTSFILVWKRRQRFWSRITLNPDNKILFLLGISSVVLLLFAMGYPFKLGMEGILDKLGFVKQFRVPGRFAWVFYFVATLFSTVIISRYFFTKVNYRFRVIVCSLILSLFAVEGIPYHLQASNAIVKNPLNKEQCPPSLLLLAEQASRQNAQAIIPLPFYHAGTDFFLVEGNEEIRNISFIVSYYSALPVMAGITPRTSLDESIRLIGLTGNNLLQKKIKMNLKADKPFLILSQKAGLTEDELQIISRAKKVAETDEYVLSKITYHELFDLSIEKRREEFYHTKTNLRFYKEHFTAVDSVLEYNHYDRESLKLLIVTKDSVELLKTAGKKIKSGQNYELSFWCFLKDRKSLGAKVRIYSDGEKVAEKNFYSVRDLYQDKLIVRLNFSSEKDKDISVVLLNARDYKIDNLLLKPKNTDAYRYELLASEKDSVLILNNFILGEK